MSAPVVLHPGCKFGGRFLTVYINGIKRPVCNGCDYVVMDPRELAPRGSGFQRERPIISVPQWDEVA